MPVFELSKYYDFPDPFLAEPDGLLAVGGDLSTNRLIKAYEKSIFPWYNDPPILWFSPDPRFVLFPEKLRISRSLKKVIRQSVFTVTYDQNFSEVMKACATVPRKEVNSDFIETEELIDLTDIEDLNNGADTAAIDNRGNHSADSGGIANHVNDGADSIDDYENNGTWITGDMIQAYEKLHQLGRAHSVEVWKDGELAGGLYGVTVGKFFCGESMFFKVPNASKVALVYLVQKMQELGFVLLDTQMHTEHVAKFGAEYISRDEYLSLLQLGLQEGTLEFPGD